MKQAVERLKRYAQKRLSDTHHESLYAYAKQALNPKMFQDLLAPEAMSIGYKTEFYPSLSEEQKLALNHWLYYLHYSRISDGEVFVTVINDLIGQLLRSHAPEIAQLLHLENQEEQDHIKAFRLIRQTIAEYYGFEQAVMPTKPLRKVFVDPAMVQWLVNYFGVDFVVVYFLSRGIMNHMGKGFETAVSKTGTTTNALIHQLSDVHTMHESHHTSVSHNLSSTARDILPQQEKINLFYRLMTRLMRRIVVWQVFSEKVTKKQESGMSFAALRSMQLFRSYSDTSLKELIAQHFRLESGVEAVKNSYIPQPNAYLMNNAALAPEHKRAWVKWMNRNRDNLTFFPEGFIPK